MGFSHEGKGTAMDSSIELIKNVRPLDYNKLAIETTAGKRYYSDLSFFRKVFCYPSEKDWKKVSIDSYGLDLVWSSRFEIHVTQVIDSAYQVEEIKQAV